MLYSKIVSDFFNNHKMKYFIYIISFLFILNGYSQSGKVAYIASTKPYFKAMDNRSKGKNIVLYEEAKDNSSDLEYILTFNNNKSLFKINDKMEIENSTQNMTKIYAGKGIYYYENNSKVTIVEKDFMGDFFLVEKEKIKWKLTNENRKIGKYNCYRAVSQITVETRKGFKTREIVAWYTPEIPKNYGPKNYNGLPGLILILKEGNLFFTAAKVELSTKDILEIKKPIKGEKISEKKYNELVKKVALNRRAYKSRY